MAERWEGPGNSVVMEAKAKEQFSDKRFFCIHWSSLLKDHW